MNQISSTLGVALPKDPESCRRLRLLEYTLEDFITKFLEMFAQSATLECTLIDTANAVSSVQCSMLCFFLHSMSVFEYHPNKNASSCAGQDHLDPTSITSNSG
jgi:hypothetical protein